MNIKIKWMALAAIVFAVVFFTANTSLSTETEIHANSFLVFAASENSLPRNIQALVKNAGGKIQPSPQLEKLGIVEVESSDPDFKKNIGDAPANLTILPNLKRQWIEPPQNLKQEQFLAINQNFGNPPNSGNDDFFFDLQWGHKAVKAVEAWNAGYRGKGVLVAVLDGGFDLEHPDLKPNINLGLSKNFVAGETLQYGLPDPFSHGTHVAGTIAAADNAFGIIGVAPEAELVLVKVLSDQGSGTFADIISGIIYAADVDANVINMSLGGSFPQSGIPGLFTAREVAALKVAINRAVAYAYQNGSTVIASAGNDASDRDKDKSMLVLPADSPHAISISATAPIGWAINPSIFLDNSTSYTNYGNSAIDFAAPGGDFIYPGNETCTVARVTQPCWVFDLVFSTGNGGVWYWAAGTSMAAPHAAGVAAIIIGKNGGNMRPAQVEAALRKAADDLGKPGNDPSYGAGRVNAFKGVM